MSANVRCAGGGWWEQAAGVGDRGRILYRDTQQPCGWEGDRFPSQYIYGASLSEGLTEEVHAEIVRRVTAKPCPRCGGRVELIPQEAAP
jgi:hypothetical protein